MSFERPLFLLLLLPLPAVWWFFRRGGSRTALAMKCLVTACLLVALAGPRGLLSRERVAVTVLMDTSASMPRQAIEEGEDKVRDLVRHNQTAEIRLVTFAETARLHGVPREPDRVSVPRDLGSGMGTDLQAALQLALATMPERGARRLLLISDGNETRGQARSAALLAASRGVPVHSLPLGGGSQLPLQVESIALPQHVFSGERFVVSVQLNAPEELSARLSLRCQGREIGAAPIKLQSGTNQVDLEARITGHGVSLLEGRASGQGEERVLFSQAITVRRPRVLYVSGDPEAARHLIETLRRSEVDVETAKSFPATANVERWDAVLLDDYPNGRLPAAESAALEKYVSVGGGLVFIAGQHNSVLPEKPREPFEKVLPVHGDPQPAPEETTAVVLVLDKSASMDGLKIAMAREAARAAVAGLRRNDRIGIIAFDSSFKWVVPMTPASDIPRIQSLINSISADGGTSIYPALASGFQAIRQTDAARKHVILLTDGWSTPGDFAQLSAEAAQLRITISTVGVGKEVNRSLLESVAQTARGKSYFVENPETIPQIISGEVRELAVTAIRERRFHPVRVRSVGFTEGVNFQKAPPLLGYVRAKARPGTETILRTDGGEPLLVRWQYGLGRAVAFLSDARNRWAAEWIGWNDYGTLWPQMVRDVCRRTRTVRAGVRAGATEGEAVVYYDVVGDTLTRPATMGSEQPRVVVAAPGAGPRSITLEETAPGHFEARIPVLQGGLYRILSGNSELLLPEAGFYRESAELRDRQINLALLEEISRVTGGRLRPSLDDLLSNEGSLVRERQPMWHWWLSLALLLNFVEVAMRKGLFSKMAEAAGRLGGRLRGRPAAPVPPPAGQTAA